MRNPRRTIPERPEAARPPRRHRLAAGPALALAATILLAVPSAFAYADPPRPREDCGDPAVPPGPMLGGLGSRDPALVVGRDGEPRYVLATGHGPFMDGVTPIRRSLAEGRSWRTVGIVSDAEPEWIEKAVPGVDVLWAPAVHIDQKSGTYYGYYTASAFGSQRSPTGLATNTTLDPSDPGYERSDPGKVFESEVHPCNAIDAENAVHERGRHTEHHMVFGSWWTGGREITSAPSGPLLGIEDASTDGGTALVQREPTGESHRQRQCTYSGNGCYRLANRNSGLARDIWEEWNDPPR